MSSEGATAWQVVGHIAAVVSIAGGIASVVAAFKARNFRDGAREALALTRSRLALTDLSKLKVSYDPLMKEVHGLNQDPCSSWWEGRNFQPLSKRISEFAHGLTSAGPSFGPAQSSAEEIARTLLDEAAKITGAAPAESGKKIHAQMVQLGPIITGSLRSSTLNDEG